MTYAGAEAGGATRARRVAAARGVGDARPLAPARADIVPRAPAVAATRVPRAPSPAKP